MDANANAPALRLAQDPEADELLSRSRLAALTGMLLDQHIRIRGGADRDSLPLLSPLRQGA
ncbi:hypothetical protein [Streptomyces sp. NPDC048385]|uniref:hypothetical protein n=1 Tax=Streptomyces sp. NPDC048385 TaxID=3155145 RepID=UPI0034413277